MSRGSNPDEWARLCSGEAGVICRRGHPLDVGDAFEGGPINPRAVTGPVHAPGEFAALRERLRTALAVPDSG